MAYMLACGRQVTHQHQAHCCDDLHLNKLFQLQLSAEQLRHPDEQLFVTTHPSSETWFKQSLFELPRCIDALDNDSIGLVIRLVQRRRQSVHALAERASGSALAGTGRSAGVSYLEATATSHRCFPELWQLLRICLWKQRQHSAHQPSGEPSHWYPASRSKAMAG